MEEGEEEEEEGEVLHSSFLLLSFLLLSPPRLSTSNYPSRSGLLLALPADVRALEPFRRGSSSGGGSGLGSSRRRGRDGRRAGGAPPLAAPLPVVGRGGGAAPRHLHADPPDGPAHGQQRQHHLQQLPVDGPRGLDDIDRPVEEGVRPDRRDRDPVGPLPDRLPVHVEEGGERDLEGVLGEVGRELEAVGDRRVAAVGGQRDDGPGRAQRCEVLEVRREVSRGVEGPGDEGDVGGGRARVAEPDDDLDLGGRGGRCERGEGEGGREGRLRSGFLEEKEESERERELSERNTQLATLTTSPASNCAPVCFGNQTEVRTPSRGSGMLVRGCIWAEAEKGKKTTFFSHGIGSEEG